MDQGLSLQNCLTGNNDDGGGIDKLRLDMVDKGGWYWRPTGLKESDIGCAARQNFVDSFGRKRFQAWWEKVVPALFSFREWGVTDVPGCLRRRTVLKPDLKRAHIDPASTWWVGSQELLQVFGVKSQG